jgi:hypothetical protein
MIRHLLISLITVSNLAAFQTQGVKDGKRISVVVQKFTGRTESDDCLIFKTTKGEFYIYNSNTEGEGYVKLFNHSLETKHKVILFVDPSLKGYVLGVLPACKHSNRPGA